MSEEAALLADAMLLVWDYRELCCKQGINIFTGAQRMDGEWRAKAYNYGNTIQGKLTWVAFP